MCLHPHGKQGIQNDNGFVRQHAATEERGLWIGRTIRSLFHAISLSLRALRCCSHSSGDTASVENERGDLVDGDIYAFLREEADSSIWSRLYDTAAAQSAWFMISASVDGLVAP